MSIRDLKYKIEIHEHGKVPTTNQILKYKGQNPNHPDLETMTDILTLADYNMRLENSSFPEDWEEELPVKVDPAIVERNKHAPVEYLLLMILSCTSHTHTPLFLMEFRISFTCFLYFNRDLFILYF